MYLRNVEIFCDVAACRSFSKAAGMHKVSQSLASQAVHMLEERLQTRLIDRSKRPLELTPAGRVYFDGCRELLDSFRKIEDRLQQMQDRVVGRARIAAIHSVGLMQMDTYVKHYAELYPGVELSLEYCHPNKVYARVRGDQADIGLVSFPRDGGEIAGIPWREQEMVLATGPDHRLAGRTSVPVAELNDEACVTFTPDLTVRKHIDRWLRRAGVSVQVVHEFDNIEHIKRAVEIGSGIALLPAPTMHREIELGSLCAISLEDVEWYRPLGIIHRRHKSLSTAAEKFVKLLCEQRNSFGPGERQSAVPNGIQTD